MGLPVVPEDAWIRARPSRGVASIPSGYESRRSSLRVNGVRCVNVYGLSEIIWPGVSCECIEERAGLHINEEHFLPEIVDPEPGESLREGEEGVLVLTTLT